MPLDRPIIVTFVGESGIMTSNHLPSRAKPRLTLIGFVAFMLLPALLAFAEAQII
ncbi:MAG: hypothetical protein AAFS13_06315 [Pseudomonadota bacterium]